jgi:hypothetical protein
LVLQGHKKRQEKKKKIISDGFSPNSNWARKITSTVDERKT